MQGSECRSPPRDQNHPRGIPIQPVYQFEIAVIRVHAAQGLYQTDADTTTSVHGKTRGFIDGQQALFLQQNRSAQTLLPLGGAGRRSAFSGL